MNLFFDTSAVVKLYHVANDISLFLIQKIKNSTKMEAYCNDYKKRGNC